MEYINKLAFRNCLFNYSEPAGEADPDLGDPDLERAGLPDPDLEPDFADPDLALEPADPERALDPPEPDRERAGDPDPDRALDPDLAEPDLDLVPLLDLEPDLDLDPDFERDRDLEPDFDLLPDLDLDLDLEPDLDLDLDPEADLEPDFLLPDLEDPECDLLLLSLSLAILLFFPEGSSSLPLPPLRPLLALRLASISILPPPPPPSLSELSLFKKALDLILLFCLLLNPSSVFPLAFFSALLLAFL